MADPESLSSTVVITLPATESLDSRQVHVKRPVHPCDRVAIELDAVVIDHILAFIREMPFDMAPDKKPQVSKGVWNCKVRGGFLIKYFDADAGKRRFKFTKSEQSAVDFQESVHAREPQVRVLGHDALEDEDVD